MSDAEKELVREYYAAWSAGDLDAMLARAHPDIEASPTLGVLYDHSVYSGHEGIRSWFDEVEGRWADFDPHVDEVYQRGGTVTALIRLTARRNDQPVDALIAVEHTFRDGRMATLFGRDYWEVREELGLPSPGSA
jgi:ketosteroid isomerase-like protein